jgi:hypothetical protein
MISQCVGILCNEPSQYNEEFVSLPSGRMAYQYDNHNKGNNNNNDNN